MTKRRQLLIFTILSTASSCVSGGFRHYDKMSTCIVDNLMFQFTCKGPNGPFVVKFDTPEADDMVCFDQKQFASHEEACHAK